MSGPIEVDSEIDARRPIVRRREAEEKPRASVYQNRLDKDGYEESRDS